MENTTTTQNPVELFLNTTATQLIKRKGEFVLVLPKSGNAPAMFLRWLCCYHDKRIFKQVFSMINNEIAKDVFEIHLNTLAITPYASAREYVNVHISPEAPKLTNIRRASFAREGSVLKLHVPATGAASLQALEWLSGKPEGYLHSVEISRTLEPGFLIELVEPELAVFEKAIEFINKNL